MQLSVAVFKNSKFEFETATTADWMRNLRVLSVSVVNNPFGYPNKRFTNSTTVWKAVVAESYA